MNGFAFDNNFEKNFLGRDSDIAKFNNDFCDELVVEMKSRLDVHATTGRQYRNLPRRSSSPIAGRKEDPQRQSGDLYKGVKWEKTKNPLTNVLYIEDKEAKLMKLEFAPWKNGGRKFFRRFLTETKTLRGVFNRVTGEGN